MNEIFTMTEISSSRGPCPLPGQLLAVLPHQPHQQLDLAHAIVVHAYSQKVSQLEADTEQLQSSLMHSQQTVKALERRLAGMEAELLEQQQRARTSLTEQHKLVAEKNALIETVKRLNREVAKLEHFKRNLLQQLQEDSEAEAAGGLGSAYAAVDLTTERLVNEVLHSADNIAAAASAAAAAAAAEPGTAAAGSQQYQQGPGGQLHGQQQAGPGAYGGGGGWSPPRQGGGAGKLQGPSSPRNSGYAGLSSNNPGGGSGGGGGGDASATAAGGGGGGSSSSSSRYWGQQRSAASPGRGAAVIGSSKAGQPASSPAAAAHDAGGAGSGGERPAGAGANSRGLAAAAAAAAPRFASPPHAGTGRGSAAAQRPGLATSPRIDGKEFFKQARAHLSYEQFSQFLEAIKDLNAGRSSREDTLAAAEALFGPSNSDLYGLFEGLLMRHLTNI